jgi:glycosyltransferase involved in cell wall biosynthesis
MFIGFDGSRINVAERTGTENYSLELLRHLLRIDQENRYLVYSRLPLKEVVAWPANAQNKVIHWSRLWTQAGLALAIAKEQPDILFIPAHTMPVVHKPSLKSVVTIHDLGAEYLPQYHTFPGKLYLNRSTEFAAKHATHLIAVSEFTKNDLIKRFGVNPSRITVVYEGVDLAKINRPGNEQIVKVKEKYQLNQPYILFVGTIQPRKNLVRLIEAFSRLNDKNINLVLAGKKGWISEEIYEAPNKFKVQDKVKFLGYIEEGDKPSLYAGAECTVLPSLFEGFGLPLLESMACQTPVVAANASSLPEVVADAGLLVDPLSVESIAQGLEKMLHDQELRQRSIIQGTARAQKFGWENAARQTLDVFHKVAEL